MMFCVAQSLQGGRQQFDSPTLVPCVPFNFVSSCQPFILKVRFAIW